MTFARSVVKLACFYTVGFLTALPVSAQHKVLPRPTQKQVANFLKSDPTLSSGFETPVHKANVRVVKAVPGGLLMRYETTNARGTITLTGSGTTIMAKDKLSEYVDWVLGLFGLKSDGGGGGGNITTTTNNGCFNGNANFSQGSGSVVINIQTCQQPKPQ